MVIAWIVGGAVVFVLVRRWLRGAEQRSRDRAMEARLRRETSRFMGDNK